MAFMLPFLGKTAASFAPMLLSHLFGGKDPGADYRNRVNQILSPQNMSRLTQGYYQSMLGSPAFSLAQRQIGAGNNAAMGRLASNAGMAGVGQSGLGALAASVGPSLAGNAMANLTSGMWGQAGQQAQNAQQQQIAALQGQMPVTQNQQFAGLGIAQMGPLLQMLFDQLGSRQGMGNATRNVPTDLFRSGANSINPALGANYPMFPTYGPPR